MAGFPISALDGSRYQIGGPTGAFVVVVAGIVGQYGVNGLFMCTMMAGVLLAAAGFLGFGTAVRFSSRGPWSLASPTASRWSSPARRSGTSSACRSIDVPGEFLQRMETLAAHAGTWSPAATALAGGSLLAMLLAMRWLPTIPPYILALVGGTAAVTVLGLHVETIGTRFGGIPSGLPAIHVPTFRADLIVGLISPALTVAMLGAIESLMSAVVADRLSGDRHNPNVELVAQGVANVVSPLIGGLPATGRHRADCHEHPLGRAHARGRHGARAIVLLDHPYRRGQHRRPCAFLCSVLAAILFVVAWRMGEWHEIPALLKQTRADIAIWLATFTLTVFADLTVAVEVGMVLAALHFIRRVATTTTVSRS